MSTHYETVSSLWHILSTRGHVDHPLGAWAYLLLGIIVMAEGPIATLLGAAAASMGLLHPLGVFAAAGSGNLVGDLLWYGLGRLGRTERLLRRGRRLHITQEQMEAMQARMRRNARKIIFVAKLTLVFSVTALVSAGVARVRLRRWFPVDVAAECIWTGSLVATGFFLSRYLERLEQGLQIVMAMGSGATILGGMLLLRRVGHRIGRGLPVCELPESAAAAQSAGAGAAPRG